MKSGTDEMVIQYEGKYRTLARWLSWLEHRPIHQDVAGSILGQGTYLGCMFGPRLGCVRKATDWCFSLSLPFPLSLKSINIPLGKDFFSVCKD